MSSTPLSLLTTSLNSALHDLDIARINLHLKKEAVAREDADNNRKLRAIQTTIQHMDTSPSYRAYHDFRTRADAIERKFLEMTVRHQDLLRRYEERVRVRVERVEDLRGRLARAREA